MTEKETLKHLLRAVGGDPDTLADNLPSTLYEAILTACGGNPEELPAKTPANYLKAIGEKCGGSGGGSPCVFITGIIPYNFPTVTTDTGYTVTFGNAEMQGSRDDGAGYFITDINESFTIEGDNLVIGDWAGECENVTFEKIAEEPTSDPIKTFKKYKVTLTGSPAIVRIVTAD